MIKVADFGLSEDKNAILVDQVWHSCAQYSFVIAYRWNWNFGLIIHVISDIKHSVLKHFVS